MFTDIMTFFIALANKL